MDDRPMISARLVAWMTLPLTAAVALCRLMIPSPQTTVPQGMKILPFAVLVALGLAVLMALVRANRHRWSRIFRVSRGKVIGAFVLAFLTPFVVVDGVPWILGMVTLSLAMGATGNVDLLFGVLLVATALWYPVACLIVSGIHRYVVRVAVFALMFWASYAAVILIKGSQAF